MRFGLINILRFNILPSCISESILIQSTRVSFSGYFIDEIASNRYEQSLLLPIGASQSSERKLQHKWIDSTLDTKLYMHSIGQLFSRRNFNIEGVSTIIECKNCDITSTHRLILYTYQQNKVPFCLQINHLRYHFGFGHFIGGMLLGKIWVYIIFISLH